MAGKTDSTRHAAVEATRSEPSSHDRRAPRGIFDSSAQAQFGRRLRDIYADIASEPVPERLVRLLEALEVEQKR